MPRLNPPYPRRSSGFSLCQSKSLEAGVKVTCKKRMSYIHSSEEAGKDDKEQRLAVPPRDSGLRGNRHGGQSLEQHSGIALGQLPRVRQQLPETAGARQTHCQAQHVAGNAVEL